MKRIAGYLIAIVAALALLAGCGSDTVPDPTLEPVAQVESTATTEITMPQANPTPTPTEVTEVMGSPVLVVPALADVPEASRANVYVFTNGVEGDGPLGFQADVFDHPPGTDGYSPLRTLNQVTWVDEGEARELKSADKVLAAEAEGAVIIEQPRVVVNMPMVIWPGGER